MNHTITVNGRKVCVWRKGPENIAPIVFLHGYAGNHKGLLAIAEPFLRDHDVIIPDLPGFGDSEPLRDYHTLQNYVRFLEEFFTTLNLPQEVTLIGHSLGGSIALQYVQKYSTRVKKLCLICPVLSCEGWMAQVAKLYYQAAEIFPKDIGKRMVDNKFLVYLTDSVVMTIQDRKKRNEILEDNYVNYKKANADALLQSFFSLYEAPISKNEPHIKIPTTLIGGLSDFITPPAPLEELHKKIPKSTLEFIEHGGHLLPREFPEKVVPLLRDFV